MEQGKQSISSGQLTDSTGERPVEPVAFTGGESQQYDDSDDQASRNLSRRQSILEKVQSR